MKELIKIQSELKAPKGQYNNFGKYKYRSCEDILESVKPLLQKYECTLLLSDDLQMIGDRYYIKATATLLNKDGLQVATTAYAREEEHKKGMDGSQITGASSSYARKYALNGLFCIDDTKDSDTTNNTTKATQSDELNIEAAIKEITKATTAKELMQIWVKYPKLQRQTEFSNNLTKRKDEITNN